MKLSVIGGYEEQPVREVVVITCPGRDVAAVLAGLASALADAASRDEPGPVFISPELRQFTAKKVPDGSPMWNVRTSSRKAGSHDRPGDMKTALPSDWVARHESSERPGADH